MSESEPIPAITIWQPWAWWLTWGWKTIETRKHHFLRSLEGRWIAIHAARHFDRDALSVARPYLRDHQVSRTQQVFRDRRYGQGRVLCLAHVAEHRLLTAADSPAALCPAEDLYGLVIDKRQLLDGCLDARGAPGIWHWTPPADARFQLPETTP